MLSLCYTSQECSFCGNFGKRIMETFICVNKRCEVRGKKRNADINTAFNIGKRGAITPIMTNEEVKAYGECLAEVFIIRLNGSRCEDRAVLTGLVNSWDATWAIASNKHELRNLILCKLKSLKHTSTHHSSCDKSRC